MTRPLFAILFFAVLLTGCGGGGSSNSFTGGTSGGGTIAPTGISITTSSIPDGVQGNIYSATLKASGGTAPYQWTVTPDLPVGLSLDSSSGTISGTPTSANYYSLTFQVSDSSSPAKSTNATLPFFIDQPLSIFHVSNLQLQEWATPGYRVTTNGGFGTVSLRLTGGSLPPGVRMDSQGLLTGAPQSTGTYTFTVTATDSYSPPDTASDTTNLVVSTAGLYLGNSFPSTIPLNRPFSGTAVANGGTPPYVFSTSGTLPPGLNAIDPSTGQISGTPTTSGSYSFSVSVSDSSSPPVNASQFFQMTVAPPLGRNDSPATATRVGNGMVQASISPFTDTPNVSTPDTDYYRILVAAGHAVHVETFAKRYFTGNPLDTVLEITDSNGTQLTTGCNQPGGSTTNFSSPCLNDDISASPHIQDSSLDYTAPSSPASQTVLVHVLDWSGNARPDMQYALQISGVIDPLVFSAPGPINFACIVNTFCSLSIMANGGVPPITYSVSTGALPPGIVPSGNLLSGTPTSTGTYNFTITAADSANQSASQQETVTVVAQLVLVTSSLPSTTVNVAKTVPLQATGGQGTYYWGIAGTLPANVLASIGSAGNLTYVATQAGTYNIPVAVSDSGTYQHASASLSMTVTP